MPENVYPVPRFLWGEVVEVCRLLSLVLNHSSTRVAFSNIRYLYSCPVCPGAMGFSVFCFQDEWGWGWDSIHYLLPTSEATELSLVS